MAMDAVPPPRGQSVKGFSLDQTDDNYSNAYILLSSEYISRSYRTRYTRIYNMIDRDILYYSYSLLLSYQVNMYCTCKIISYPPLSLALDHLQCDLYNKDSSSSSSSYLLYNIYSRVFVSSSSRLSKSCTYIISTKRFAHRCIYRML